MANVRDVARFFIELSNGQASQDLADCMTNLRLQKVLYFAQGYYLAMFEKPLFDANFEAWENGPVIPKEYFHYKKYGSETLHDIEVDRLAFTDEEYEYLFDIFNWQSTFKTSLLVDMSHAENGPWYPVFYSDRKNKSISKDDIAAYFRKQPKIPTFSEQLAKIAKAAYIPERDQDGVPIIPYEYIGDWSI